MSPGQALRPLLLSATAVAMIGCGEMMSSYELLTEGPPTVPYDEARSTEHQWFVIEGAVVRSDVLGHSTFKHGRYNDQQRFVAPLVPSAGAEVRGELWVGCRSTGPDVEAERATCLERMSVESPVLARDDVGLFRQALDDALRKHAVTPRNPRVLRVASSPESEAWEAFIAPLVVLVVFSLVSLAAYGRSRRRAS